MPATLAPDNIGIAVENTGPLPVITTSHHRERPLQLVYDMGLAAEGTASVTGIGYTDA